MSRKRLVPRLCLGTHRPRGSASQAAANASCLCGDKEAEPPRHCVPRQSLGTRTIARRANRRGDGFGRRSICRRRRSTRRLSTPLLETASSGPAIRKRSPAALVPPTRRPTAATRSAGARPIAVSRAISTKEPGAGTTPAGSSNAASASTGSTACDIKAARAPTKPTARGYSMCISSVLASYNVTVDEPNGS